MNRTDLPLPTPELACRATGIGLPAARCMRAAAVVFVVLLVAACASTTLRTAWFDSTYTGGPFKRILVIGVSGNMADRRVFEDMFAQMLTAAGVQGIPGYQFIPDAPSASEPTFNEGVAKSGADGLLLVRLLGVDQHTEVSTIMVPRRSGLTGPRGDRCGMRCRTCSNIRRRTSRRHCSRSRSTVRMSRRPP